MSGTEPQDDEDPRALRETSTGRAPQVGPVIAGARDVAFRILDEHYATGVFVAPLLDRAFADADLSDADRRFARELVSGTIRRTATLDALLAPNLRRPLHELEPGLRTLLRLGTYQAALLPSIPLRAALHETGETARRAGAERWVGFANGVLRSVSRLLTDESAERPAVDALPLASGRYRRLAAPVFPDPHADPVGHLAAAFSWPRWLIERWSTSWPFGELVRLSFWFDAPAPIVLRVNSLRSTRDELLASLRGRGVSCRPGTRDEAVVLEGPARIETLPGFREGLFVVQDESAMEAGVLLDPRPGQRVLDVCAAPGTKTSHLAERMRNEGSVLATDVAPAKLPRVQETCRRLGLTIVETQPIGPDPASLPHGPFDRILVDAPCSNTGVLGKRVEARWRLSPRDFPELADTQLGLLLAAAERLRTGGRLVYSTCSIDPEENDALVRRALAANPSLRLLDSRTHRPGLPGDGGYQALLVRLGTGPR